MRNNSDASIPSESVRLCIWIPGRSGLKSPMILLSMPRAWTFGDATKLKIPAL